VERVKAGGVQMIEAENYKKISSSMGQAYICKSEIENLIDDSISYLDGVSSRPEISDVINFASSSFDSARSNLVDGYPEPNLGLFDSVVSLQKAVEANHESIDSFLSDRGIQVTSFFASLSLKCGYPILGSNIEP
jgi:hypothetical protein